MQLLLKVEGLSELSSFTVVGLHCTFSGSPNALSQLTLLHFDFLILARALFCYVV